MKMLNGEIVTSPTLKPKKAAPISIGNVTSLKPPGCQHETGRDDEKHKPDQAGNEDAVSSSELRLKPMLVISRCPSRAVGARPALIASSGRTIDMNKRQVTAQTQKNCSRRKLPNAAYPIRTETVMAKATTQETKRKMSNQSLCRGDLGAETIVGIQGAAEAPQLDTEHDRSRQGRQARAW